MTQHRFVGRPILAAAGFRPALFAPRFGGFRRKRRSGQGRSVVRVNVSFARANHAPQKRGRCTRECNRKKVRHADMAR
jgi:hypothetical protein